MRLALASAIAALAAAPSASGQHWIDAPVFYDALVAGVYTATGDFDGDGDADLIGALGATFTPLLNDGSGSMSAAALVQLGSGGTATSARALDFDGDGLVDLACHRTFPGPTEVLLVRSLGGGVFAAPVSVPMSGGVYRMFAGQADGDPARELGVFSTSHPNYSVGWIDWNGGAPVVGSPGTRSASWGYSDAAALDLDGDGDDDFAMASNQSIDFLITGAGAAVSYSSTETAAFPPGSYPELEGADLDGDGDDDLLAYQDELFDSDLIVLENIGAGPLVEHAVQSLAIDMPYAVHLADWDVDGDVDILSNDQFALSGAPSFHQVRNDGNLSFSAASSTNSTYTGIGAGVADVDGDSNPDFVAPIYVAWGDRSFTGLYGTQVSGGVFSTSMGIADLDGDGDLDLPQGNSYFANDNGGSFTIVSNWPPAARDHIYSSIGALADFSGDGRGDYLVRYLFFQDPFNQHFESMHLLADDGLGGYADLGPALPDGVDVAVAFGLAPFLKPTADVDDDGDLDLLMPGGAWLNDGSGDLMTYVVMPWGTPSAVHDVDGDGDDDLVAHDGTNPIKTRLYSQVAPLTFVFTEILWLNQVDLNPRIVDLDGDGIRDFYLCELLSYAGPSILHLLKGNGVGFDAPVSLPSQASLQNSLAADDVDGDGVLDLLTGRVSTFASPNLLVYRGLGGQFQYEDARAYLVNSALEFADLDEDGDLDVVGSKNVAGHRFHGPDDGFARQYGAGVAGSGGAVPVLGATGPLRQGSTEASLKLARASGGALTFLAIAAAEGSVPGLPTGVTTALVDPNQVLALLTLLSGGSGPGQGNWTIPITVNASMSGLSLFHQVFALDLATPGFLSQTGGLEIHYGF